MKPPGVFHYLDLMTIMTKDFRFFSSLFFSGSYKSLLELSNLVIFLFEKARLRFTSALVKNIFGCPFKIIPQTRDPSYLMSRPQYIMGNRLLFKIIARTIPPIRVPCQTELSQLNH